MALRWLVSVLILAFSACSTPEASPAKEADVAAYKTLRDGYAARDAETVGAAYADGAEVRFEAEKPIQTAIGAAEIKALYQSVLDSMPKDEPLDLNFRIENRTIRNSEIVEDGAYRLRAGKAGTAFGRFAVRRNERTGLFVLDRSLPGTREDFERISGPVLFDADSDDLDPEFYGRLTGRYALEDGCALVVTHSVVRVLVRNSCDHSWRGLDRVNGLNFTFGNSVVPDTIVGKIQFSLSSPGPAPSLELQQAGKSVKAVRQDPFRREDVMFTSADGTSLGATIWTPKAPASAATVLIHGSGPQDRNGYASIMAVIADELVANGHIVLAYDKRGSGQSDGDGARAGFDILATDAEAARQFLMKRPDARNLPSGFAGSSQAGWVAAEAVRAGSKPDHVILIGAAGAALSVEEQNLYNTETQMRCAGIGADDIDLALAQQRAFFDALSRRAGADKLEALTTDARKRPSLADWIFPGPGQIDRTSPDWYNVLDLDFDPLEVWSTYTGKLILIQGQHDDSTPFKIVDERWKGLNLNRARPAQVLVLRDAQHIGLKVDDLCQTDLNTITGFSPGFMAALQDAARRTHG